MENEKIGCEGVEAEVWARPVAAEDEIEPAAAVASALLAVLLPENMDAKGDWAKVFEG